METNKDLILRQIRILSDFLVGLSKQKKVDSEEISIFINEFLIKNFCLTLELLLEKPPKEIENIIAKNNVEDINNFADILFLKYRTETNELRQNILSNIIIHLYQSYQNKSGTYSFEIQSKINQILEKENIS